MITRNKRKGVLFVSRSLLMDLIPLPEDTGVHVLGVDFNRDGIALQIDHESFPEVKEGGWLPHIQLILKKEDDKLVFERFDVSEPNNYEKGYNDGKWIGEQRVNDIREREYRRGYEAALTHTSYKLVEFCTKHGIQFEDILS